MRKGSVVAAVARRAEDLAKLTAVHPGHIQTYPADVRDSAALQHAAHDFSQTAGLPDLVIASAGVSCGTLTEHAEDLRVFQDIMDINVVGVVKTFQPFITQMRKRGSGTLVAIASVAGIRGLPGGSGYSASKAALINYLEALRIELRGTGVNVLTVRPGYIRTPMTAVNPYRMPFLLEPQAAAARIARAVEKRRAVLTLPWQMSIVCRILAILPRPLFDQLFQRAPRKPRNLI